MKTTLSRVFAAGACAVALLPLAASAVAAWIASSEVSAAADSAFDKSGAVYMRQTVSDLNRICAAADASLKARSREVFARYRKLLASFGEARLTEYTYSALIRPYNRQTAERFARVNNIAFGDTVLGVELNDKWRIVANSGSIASALDALKTDTGFDFAMFLRMDEAGNLLAVASTARRADGSRAVGTYIPAKDSEVVRAVLLGKPYSGLMRNSDTENLLADFEPLADESGKIVGALAIVRHTSVLDYVFKNFEAMRLGTGGFVWAVEASSPEKYVVRVSQDGRRNGTVLQDSSGAAVSEMIKYVDEALLAGGGGGVILRAVGARSNVRAYMAFTYFEPWNIVVGAFVARDDFATGGENLKAASGFFGLMLVMLAAAVLLAVACIAYFAGLRMRGAMRNIAKISGMISDGDFEQAAASVGGGAAVEIAETHAVEQLLAATARKTGAIASKLLPAVVGAEEAASKIDRAVRDAEISSAKTAEFLANLSEASNTVYKLVSAIAVDARAIADSFVKTRAEFEEGLRLFGALSENSRRVAETGDAVASALVAVKTRTDKIAGASLAVSKLSARINMLSLNAAVEAAPVRGAFDGFAALSVEIRKLADTASVASMKVSGIVAEVSDSVDSAITDIRNFSARIRSSNAAMAHFAERMKSASRTLEILAPKFAEISAAADERVRIAANLASVTAAISREGGKSEAVMRSIKADVASIGGSIRALAKISAAYKRPEA